MSRSGARTRARTGSRACLRPRFYIRPHEQRITRVLALEHRREGEACIERGPQVFQTMHRRVDLAREHGAVDLPREECLAADLPERDVRARIALRADADELDRWRAGLGRDELCD